MKKSFEKILEGYHTFREKYVHDDKSIMQHLSIHGQKPDVMVVACCDARVDPALMLQCDPGDLFVVRNVANIVPPYEKDAAHHGTSAALEFGICGLKVEHLILLGHSQCGGIQALLENHQHPENKNDFINSWVSIVETNDCKTKDTDDYARFALQKSYDNCMTFPWIKEKVADESLLIHLWFFDIKSGQIFTYCDKQKAYQPLDIWGASCD